MVASATPNASAQVSCVPKPRQHPPRSVFSAHVEAARPTRRILRERALCVACGCVLASDNRGPLCSPCQRRDEYDPRLDGAFPRLLAEYMASRVGGRADPVRHFNMPADARVAVWKHIQKMRRDGWVIDGCPPPRGGYIVHRAPPGTKRRRSSERM